MVRIEKKKILGNLRQKACFNVFVQSILAESATDDDVHLAYNISGIMVTANQAFQADSNDDNFSDRHLDSTGKLIVLFRQSNHCHPQDLLVAFRHCDL